MVFQFPTTALLHPTFRSSTPHFRLIELRLRIHIPPRDLVVDDANVVPHPLTGHEDGALDVVGEDHMGKRSPVVVLGKVLDQPLVFVGEAVGSITEFIWGIVSPLRLFVETDTGSIDHLEVMSHEVNEANEALVKDIKVTE